ncbi:MAG: hypothetical protein ACRD0B_04310, partial [Acidimicrobiales bacterium]
RARRRGRCAADRDDGPGSTARGDGSDVGAKRRRSPCGTAASPGTDGGGPTRATARSRMNSHLDSQRQWAKWRNVWYNAAIRSFGQSISAPLSGRSRSITRKAA